MIHLTRDQARTLRSQIRYLNAYYVEATPNVIRFMRNRGIILVPLTKYAAMLDVGGSDCLEDVMGDHLYREVSKDETF